MHKLVFTVEEKKPNTYLAKMQLDTYEPPLEVQFTLDRSGSILVVKTLKDISEYGCVYLHMIFRALNICQIKESFVLQWIDLDSLDSFEMIVDTNGDEWAYTLPGNKSLLKSRVTHDGVVYYLKKAALSRWISIEMETVYRAL